MTTRQGLCTGLYGVFYAVQVVGAGLAAATLLAASYAVLAWCVK